jgi:hypothetical protein
MGRPFISNNLVTDPNTDSILKFIMGPWTFQQAIQKLGNKVLPAPNERGKTPNRTRRTGVKS